MCRTQVLLSNFLAQTEALMLGKTEEEVRAELEKANLPKDQVDRLLPHKVLVGGGSRGGGSRGGARWCKVVAGTTNLPSETETRNPNSNPAQGVETVLMVFAGNRPAKLDHGPQAPNP